MSRVTVRLDKRSYPIAIGVRHVTTLQRLLTKHVAGGRLFVVCDAQWYALHGERLVAQLGIPKSRVLVSVVPAGERAKSSRVLAELYDYLLALRIERGDFVLSCGGGVTTDLVGYAAATVVRGIRWGAAPTTLVGMVDASIGGKTGVNHARGKNLIGAIWQPSFVWSDLSFLHTLPRRQMVSGLGELLKGAGLAGGPYLREFADYVRQGNLYDMPRLLSLVQRGAAYKATIVARDEREAGIRAWLNFGHTFGHAIEKATGYRSLLHGEAVILGISSALRLAQSVNPGGSRQVSEYSELVDACMRLVPRRKIDEKGIMEALAWDKKRSGGAIRFVLLRRPGHAVIADDVSRADVRKALRGMVARFSELGGRNG